MQGTQRCIGRQEKTVWTRTYNVCVHIHMSHVAEGEQHEQFTLPLISFFSPPTVGASHLLVSMTYSSGFHEVCFSAFHHLLPCVHKLITGQSAWGTVCGPTGSRAVNKHECKLPCCMVLGLTTAALSATVDLLFTTSPPRTNQLLLFYLHNICRSNYSYR